MTNPPFWMTKKGYKDKFIKTFLTISIGWYILMLAFLWWVDSIETFIFWYWLVVYYTFIPSVIIALIWEFFKES